MTTKQMAELLLELEMTYPDGTYVWRETPANRAAVIRVWQGALGDLPAEMVQAAIKRWIATRPRLPHVSDIRGLITEAVNPLPSEGEVWSRRMAYFRTGRGEAAQDEDTFAFAVYAEIGTPADCGQMSPDDLRESVKWAYKRLAEKERAERTATVEGALAPAVVETPRLRAIGS